MDVVTISVPQLAFSFIPVAIVVVLMWRCSQDYGHALQAIARMLLQLTLIGHVLSLPGMMTGQILSGVSPLIAVRYQIMVMCMIFGTAGLSTVCFLTMIRKTEYFREIK